MAMAGFLFMLVNRSHALDGLAVAGALRSPGRSFTFPRSATGAVAVRAGRMNGPINTL